MTIKIREIENKQVRFKNSYLAYYTQMIVKRNVNNLINK